jgi:hypothetical protein
MAVCDSVPGGMRADRIPGGVRDCPGVGVGVTKAEILRRIRAKCLDCVCGSHKEVELCPIPDCDLYDLRFGKDPTKRQLSPEAKKALSDRLQSAKLRKRSTHTREKN